jgi:hypothetical protein
MDVCEVPVEEGQGAQPAGDHVGAQLHHLRVPVFELVGAGRVGAHLPEQRVALLQHA